MVSKGNPVEKKKKTRRSKKKQVVNSVNKEKFVVYHVNPRGVTSKSISLQNIVKSNDIDADVITLVETNLKRTKKVEIEGYTCYSRNRNVGKMGGIATLVKNTAKDSVIKVGEGSDGNEYIITRHNEFKIPINIITLYGEKESRSTVEAVTDN